MHPPFSPQIQPEVLLKSKGACLGYLKGGRVVEKEMREVKKMVV